MDIDAFVAVHKPAWDRLGSLGRRRQLSAAEADEMLVLYQRASTHLSMIQAVEPDSPVAVQLSSRIAAARAQFTGVGENVFSSAAYFFTQTLPLAFWRIRWLTVIIGAAFISLAVASALWVQQSGEVMDLVMPEAARQAYAQEDFVSYYSEHPSSAFSAQVWTNNAWIAAQSVAFGITGFMPVWVLGLNAVSVGIAAAVMHEQGEGADFWLYILPHGMMEITAIFVAGAAGLRIFWAWIVPGRQTRLSSVAREARKLITVALGLVLLLLISGVVEGFVTPAEWMPHWVRLLIGALVFTGYWVYTLVLGGRAARAGVNADLGRFDSGDHELTA